MSLVGGFGVFGTRTRTNVLLALALMEESHASELARILEVDVSTVQNAVDTLAQANVVSSALEGRTRRIRLNPRFYARDELRALLDKMALNAPELMAKIADHRRRPRRSGKPL